MTFLFRTMVVFLLYVCSCDNVPNKATAPEPPITQPKKPPRTVGAIPADLVAQTYTDTTGSTVLYDHKAQLEQLFALETQGKELWLIIGRGNKETNDMAIAGTPYAPLDTKGGVRVWVYSDIDPSKLMKDATPHLYMDFGKKEHLGTIPDGLFAGIAFDNSVVKLVDVNAASPQYYRILRDKGLFFADLMLQGSMAWQTDAQKTMGCINQQRKIYTTSTGREYCLLDWETALIYHDPAGIPSTTNAEEAEMEARRIALIKNYLGSIFAAGHCIAKNTGYPVTENTSDYLQCTK